MNTNIHKCTEIHNIADSSLEHHPRSQVFHIQHIASEHRARHLITRISGRLFQLLYNILQSQFTNAQLFCRFLRLTYFLRDTFQSSSDNILCGISKRSQKLHSCLIALRMYTGSIQRVVSIHDPKESCTLLISLRSQLRHFQKLSSVCESAVRFSVCHNIFCQRLGDAGNVLQKWC